MASKAAVGGGIALALLVALGIYAYSSEAEAGEPDEGDDEDDLPDLPGTGDEPGKGPGGSPKPVTGGKVWGDAPPGAQYMVPADWDPVRGLWIAPDCAMVVEAPGWFCGSTGDSPNVFGGDVCTEIEHDSYAATMAEPENGVAGYVDFLIGNGMQPEDIAWQILAEVSPFCASVDPQDWPDGLWAWWEGFLERVILWWEEYTGIEFEPEAA